MYTEKAAYTGIGRMVRRLARKCQPCCCSQPCALSASNPASSHRVPLVPSFSKDKAHIRPTTYSALSSTQLACPRQAECRPDQAVLASIAMLGARQPTSLCIVFPSHSVSSLQLPTSPACCQACYAPALLSVPPLCPHSLRRHPSWSSRRPTLSTWHARASATAPPP